ncbi:MAG: hypothetical protein IPI67_35720 [Myxococcales bacterium]|nr:hypothetical protein [Myxococcales bacterium]
MRLRAPAFALGLFVYACGTSATVRLHRGGEVQGRIAEARPGYVVIEENDGRRLAVPRREVADVRHPGTPAMVMGGAVTVLSIPLVAATAFECGGPDEGGFMGNDCEKARATVLIPAVALLGTGIGMVVWGLTTYEGSRARAEGTHDDAPTLAPRSAPEGEWRPPF